MAKSVELPSGGDGWLLTDKEYKSLVEDSEFLANLHAAGVDNWEGYHYGSSGYDEDDE